jgi:predicted RNA-binding protein YlxR (DUF448 family)
MPAIAEEDETGSERTCIVTRKRSSPETMLRFVRAPDGTVVPDLKRKLPGRGVWLTPNRAVIEMAVKKKAFARAFKTEVKVAIDLAEIVDGLLERSAREAFSLANKAGQVVAGFGKVEEALGHGGVLAILHASDAASDGIRKVAQLVRRAQEAGSREIKVIATMPSDDLGLALGRSHVIHAALLGGSAALACLARMEFLRVYGAVDNAALGFETQVTQPN